ncbi:hypothetical protein Mapa_009461 [Marchantia paleacea]|nr:hypothetical protein Mapa_009461 [Marchantia paleacea]
MLVHRLQEACRRNPHHLHHLDELSQFLPLPVFRSQCRSSGIPKRSPPLYTDLIVQRSPFRSQRGRAAPTLSESAAGKPRTWCPTTRPPLLRVPTLRLCAILSSIGLQGHVLVSHCRCRPV